jgi:hypothetical protein
VIVTTMDEGHQIAAKRTERGGKSSINRLASGYAGTSLKSKLLYSFSESQKLRRPSVVVGSGFVCYCQLGPRGFTFG